MLNQSVLSFLSHAAEDARVTLPDSDASLFISGVLDSFTLVDFVSVIENEYGIRVDDADLRPENFDTMQSVERFVIRARGEQ